MKTIKQLLSILTIAGIGFFLQNCGRDNDCTNKDTVTDYPIYEDDLEKIPYVGFESLTFVRTTVGDTHVFTGNGWKEYWGLTSTQDDCPEKERYEKREVVFSSTTFSHPITVSVYRHDITKSTFLNISFQNTSFLTSPGRIRSPYNLDSLNILGTQYYGITVVSNLNSATPETYKCYYNKQFGILRLFFENGETWDLLKQ